MQELNIYRRASATAYASLKTKIKELPISYNLGYEILGSLEDMQCYIERLEDKLYQFSDKKVL